MGVDDSFAFPAKDHQGYTVVEQAGFIAQYSEGDHTLREQWASQQGVG